MKSVLKSEKVSKLERHQTAVSEWGGVNGIRGCPRHAARAEAASAEPLLARTWPLSPLLVPRPFRRGGLDAGSGGRERQPVRAATISRQ